MAISSNTTGLRPGVCTSTSRPSSPYEGQMIYETDTDLVYLWNGSAWIEVVSALTKAPRGMVVKGVRTTNTGAVGAMTVSISYISFTAVANRNYRITYFEPAAIGASGNVYANLDIREGTAFAGSTVLSGSTINTYGGYGMATCQYIGTFSTGNHNIVTTVYPPVGTINLTASSSSPAFITIEDIGAV